jgi:hypothetical protein
MEVDPFASVADAMKETGDDDAPDRFKLVVSVMVAVAAITIALVAWGSGVISNKSGDESSATIGSAVRAQQADFDSRLQSLQDHAGYLSYRRNNLSGDLLFNYLQSAAGRNDPVRASLQRDATQSWDVGLGMDGFFSTRFTRNEVAPDGVLRERYDVQRQYESGKADAAKERDVNSDKHLSDLDKLLDKQAAMIGAIVVIGLAIWLMTLAYDAQARFRLYPAGLSVIVYAAGAGFASYTYFWT